MAQTDLSPMGIFERFLSIWVGLCMAAGVGLGLLMPSSMHSYGICMEPAR
jgi:ACR3 family arsenite transporter